ncbi:MAG: hypothetical protein RIG77_18120 [Cyclobacteriaceae bacterium]
MKRIALVDIHTGGHHLAFMRLFAKAMLELGNEVWVFYPEEKNVKEWVEDNCKKGNNRIEYFNLKIQEENTQKLGPFDDVFRAGHLWFQLNKTIKATEKRMKEKVDLVFLAWLDSFLACNFPKILHKAIFRYKWSGLYFHPYHLRLEPDCLNVKSGISAIDYLLTSDSCISVAIHDAHVSDKFSKNRLLGKKVIVFPETADDTPANSDNPLAQEIKEKAKGRLIVGSIGLAPHQGLTTLIKTAIDADSEKFFFVFIGEINLEHFSKSDQELINSFFENIPQNCLLHANRIPEGSYYNSVFSSLDIIFLVYNNFISTSNRLTKAAIFEKKVLAQNNFCIGEDVEKYKLGVTVPPGDFTKCIESLKTLKQQIADNSFKPDFNSYRQLNSFDKLKYEMRETLTPLTSHIND